jgi:uncharacterized protein YbbC (DUF1343 family)/CubicO group peptidase (beta-lactamase class C family)
LKYLAVLGLLAAFLPAALAQAPGPTPAGVDHDRLARIDEIVNAAIRDEKLPGAVVLVWHRGAIAYQKAFGSRASQPVREPMTLDTVFDLASLTKVVATTPSVMRLVEEGRLRLNDPVVSYIPEFARQGKQTITIRHLLTHVSGLRADLDLEPEWVGYERAMALAADERPLAKPGEQFVYSDINFLVLGEILTRVTGQRLDEFARTRIFAPLGMRETTFNPPTSLAPRIAPTEWCTPYGWPCGVAVGYSGGSRPLSSPAFSSPTPGWLRGNVHDPTARRMGGVAGHAGLFSTASDLAVFCEMLLSGGSRGGVRILAPLTVELMTSVATPDGMADSRGLGWDVDSRYSSNRGELFPVGSFGHTGFTGTSLWLDARSETFVIFLSNRVHPDGRGDVTPLRARVATIAAASVTNADRGSRFEVPGSRFRVQGPELGIDVLRHEGFARLRGRRVGLVTNQTGRARDGQATIDLLRAARDVELVALFSPEHGIRGTLDGPVSSSRDDRTGLPIHSLYGDTRRPTNAMLQSMDTLVVDLQDVGARFYTYATTLGYVMEAAARHGIRVVVLDRPNPIGGADVEGPLLDADAAGFTGYFRAPIRHGLTMGELARLFNAEKQIGADVEVVAMRGWRRRAWFDELGLTWVNPSPNIRNLIQATLYPGLGAIEDTNLSVGRGTDAPFEQIGAPWIDGPRLAAELNRRNLAGIRFYPVSFTPSAGTYARQLCHGVFLVITDRQALRPVRVGLEIAAALERLHGGQFDLDAAHRLLGSRDALRRIRAGDDPADIALDWLGDEYEWRRVREKYLLYE